MSTTPYHRYFLISYLGSSLNKIEPTKLENLPSGCFTLVPLNELPLLEYSPSFPSHSLPLVRTFLAIHFGVGTFFY